MMLSVRMVVIYLAFVFLAGFLLVLGLALLV